jgi:hypothetical protein
MRGWKGCRLADSSPHSADTAIQDISAILRYQPTADRRIESPLSSPEYDCAGNYATLSSPDISRRRARMDTAQCETKIVG